MAKGNFIVDLEALLEEYNFKIRDKERKLSKLEGPYKHKVEMSIRNYKEAKEQCQSVIDSLAGV